MKKVVMYETFDGRLHLTLFAAEEHARKFYRSSIQQIADELLDVGSRRQEMFEYVERSVDRLARLQKIRDDVKLVDETEP